jgi:hypothetical protein
VAFGQVVPALHLQDRIAVHVDNERLEVKVLRLGVHR